MQVVARRCSCQRASTLLDGILWVASAALFIGGLVCAADAGEDGDSEASGAPLCRLGLGGGELLLLGLAAWVTYPLVLEAAKLALGCCRGAAAATTLLSPLPHGRVPFIYHARYNITAWGLENIHPFDSQKYRRVYEYLLDAGALRASQVVAPTRTPTDDELRLVHTRCHLAKLSYSLVLTSYLEVPVCCVPSFILRWRVLEPMLWATQGTISALHGRSHRQLGGSSGSSYAHSVGLSPPLCPRSNLPSRSAVSCGAREQWPVRSPWSTAGRSTAAAATTTPTARRVAAFACSATVSARVCRFSSCRIAHAVVAVGCPAVSLSIQHLRRTHRGAGGRKLRAMIVDLDAHQGNGHERDFMHDDDTFILDAYHHGIYPGDATARRAINSELQFRRGDRGDWFLPKLRTALVEAVEQFEPDILYYNAGTDCLIGDPLGGLSLTAEAIAQRDEIVFEQCLEHRPSRIPIVMVLSGGYQKNNAEVIAHSLLRINERWGLFQHDS